MFGRLCLVIFCAVVCFFLPWQKEVLSAEVQTEFKVGVWEGASYFENGSFAYCLVGRLGNNRKYLMMLRAPSVGYALTVYDTSAPFQENATYKTFTRVDNSWTLRAQGIGATNELLRILIPENQVPRALDEIASGGRLRVDVDGIRKLSVSLRGSRKAIDRLEQCYAENVQLAQSGGTTDVKVIASRRVKRLADAVGVPVPAGNLADLRSRAESLDATAVIVLGLALIDLPEHTLYEDEASSLISLAADAGDVRALYVLGRMIQMGLTAEAYDGHAEELIAEAAAGGLSQAIQELAKSQQPADQPSSSQGTDGEIKQLEQQTSSVSQSASTPTSAKPQISVTQSQVSGGSQIEARFSGLPEPGINWLAVAAEDHTAEQYFDLAMLEEGTLAGSHRFKELPAGRYEVRLYLNWPDGGYAIADAVKVTVEGAQPTESADPAPSAGLTPPEPDYKLMGTLACFGTATYPDAWRDEAKCRLQGCFFGEHDLKACLAIAEAKKASIVMHGLPQGLWPNECWLQNSCSDMREQPDFQVYRSNALSGAPLAQSAPQAAPAPETPLQEAHSMAELQVTPATAAPDGTIEVSIADPGDMGPGAWLGLFPEGASGGSDTANAETVFVRKAIGGNGGAIRFPVPSREGSYEIRLSDPDLDAELARISFKVELDRSAASLTLQETVFEPGATIEVSFTASADYRPDSWIGIVPARTAHGSANRNLLHAVSHETLSGTETGQLNFVAPDEAGDYEIRLNETGNDLELAAVAFSVAAPLVAVPESSNTSPDGVVVTAPEPGIDLVITVQSLLSVMGYDVGIPDGQVTQKTQEAIRAFQRDTGLTEDVSVTTDLRDALLAEIAARKEASQ